MKTKIFTLCFALVASVGTMFAQSGTCGENLTWSFDQSTGLLTISGSGDMTDYEDLYDASDNYLGCNTPWYEYCKLITSVSLPDGLISIGNNAFADCKYLTSINIPDNVQAIGSYAFYDCIRLTSIIIPNSVTTIYFGAFSGCSGVVSVSIGTNVTLIEDEAFNNCNKITSVVWNAKNCNKRNFGSQVESFVFGIEVEVIPSLICSGMSKLTNIIIPNSVKSIGSKAFYKCTGLTSIEIPNSVTNIGNYAFYGCSGLTSVVIGNNVTNIGDYAFCGCSGFTSIEIPNSVTSLGKCAFSQCTKLISAIIGDSVTSISDRSFYRCLSLTSVTIGNSVTSIGQGAFRECTALTSVDIPNSVISIGDTAFYYCTKLTSAIIGNNVTRIGKWTFMNCHNLTSITIPNSVTSLEDRAFFDCGLTHVTIGNSVTSIGLEAFYSCPLTSVIIPHSVKSIGRGAFHTLDMDTVIWNAKNCDDIDIYDEKYSQNYPVFSDSVKVFIFGDDVETTPYNLMYGMSGVKSIIWNARNCQFKNPKLNPFEYNKDNYSIRSQITSFKFGQNVESIPDYLCHQMSNLSGAITIPNSVTSIGNYAFDQCSSLTSINIPNKVTKIGTSAFAGITNRNLNKIELPVIKTIGSYAFEGWSYVETIDFGRDLENIGLAAFYGCTRVAKMTCLAEITPTVESGGLSSISSQAELYVLKSSMSRYQLDNNWNRFILKEIGATEVTGNIKDVSVEAGDNTATFIWPTNENASTYSIEISKNGEIFCTLMFNSNGQLTNIAFAPSRNSNNQTSAAALANGGMQFTVTGLDIATRYEFILMVKDGMSQTLVEYAGTFGTTGAPQGISDINAATKSQKIVRDGQVLILRGDRTYTTDGRVVR